MNRRGLLVAAVAGVCLAAGSVALLARPAVVRTREGQVYDGDLQEKAGDDFVTVTVRGIPTRIARGDISEVTEGSGVDVEYKTRLAKLEPTDAKGRMDLARWAFDQKRYDLARDAADKALQVDPNSADAVQFLNLVQSQQRMERARARAASGPAAGAEEGNGGREATTRGGATQPVWRYLTGGDINRIRQEELRKTDTRVRFQFRNDVEKRFLNQDREFTLQDWRAMPPLERAINILDRGDPNLRDDVVITSDPQAILEFRRLVQPLVIANCATTACHGGMSAGPLVLSQAGETNEPATYTNFYILQQFAQKVEAAGDRQSVFGGGLEVRRMIDRGHPEDSLLLQYGLPRNQAKFPHPEVLGFRPAFNRGRVDPKYQAIEGWIGSTLAPVDPNYGIDYRPPTGERPGRSATRSADGKAAAATRPARQR